MHGQHGLKWSHFILLAFVLVLGIIVPMAWHRKHGRNPIEPLHPRFIRVTPPSKAATPVPSHAPQWRIDLASTDRSGSAKIAASEFRRYCSIADPPPYFRSPAWPRPHAFIEKLEFLEEKGLGRCTLDAFARLEFEFRGERYSKSVSPLPINQPDGEPGDHPLEPVRGLDDARTF